MALRKVTKSFFAKRLPRGNDASCAALRDWETEDDVEFTVGRVPLNDGFNAEEQVVNGRRLVRFSFGDYAYCVEHSVYEACTVHTHHQQ